MRRRILITNLTLATGTGTEFFVRDLALGLTRAGHLPWVYTPDPGPLAAELRAAGIAVASDLNGGETPDLIHAHHLPAALAALVRFPGVPALFVVHDRTYWTDAAPRHPRICRYVAVDDACRARLAADLGRPALEFPVIHNAVDLARFGPRAPLPARPARALLFSNAASQATVLPAARAACARRGIALDAIGAGLGRPCPRPEEVLGLYDLVFAKARCALEALAVGCAVVLCDERGGLGELVTPERFDRLRRLNFGETALGRSVSAEALGAEIDRYDPASCAAAAARAREVAALPLQIARFLALYEEVLEEARTAPPGDGGAAERAAAAAALQALLPRLSDWHYLQGELGRLRGVERRAADLEADRDRLATTLAAIEQSTTIRARNRLVAAPLLGGTSRALARLLAGRPRGGSLPTPQPPPMPVIVGVPRSGTTLLRLMLDSHPQLAIPPETGWLAPAAALPDDHPDLEGTVLGLILSAPQWPDFQLDAAALTTAFAAIRPFTRSAGARAFYRLYAGRFGKPRWGDKTPGYSDHLEAIERLLPEAAFLHLIRDGRDVAVSVRPLGFAPGTTPEELAQDWCDRIRRARLQAGRCRRYLEVRYEELIRHPRRVLARICRFLALPYTAAIAAYPARAATRLAEHGPRFDRGGQLLVSREQRLAQQRLATLPPDPARIGRWRAEMSLADRRRFEGVAGPLLAELGYPRR